MHYVMRYYDMRHVQLLQHVQWFCSLVSTHTHLLMASLNLIDSLRVRHRQIRVYEQRHTTRSNFDKLFNANIFKIRCRTGAMSEYT